MSASRRVHSILRINITSQGPCPQLQASLELLKTCSSMRSAIRQPGTQFREGRGESSMQVTRGGFYTNLSSGESHDLTRDPGRWWLCPSRGPASRFLAIVNIRGNWVGGHVGVSPYLTLSALQARSTCMLLALQQAHPVPRPMMLHDVCPLM